MSSPFPSVCENPRKWRKHKKRIKPTDNQDKEEADIIFHSNCFSDAKYVTDNPNPRGDNWMDEINLELQKELATVILVVKSIARLQIFQIKLCLGAKPTEDQQEPNERESSPRHGPD